MIDIGLQKGQEGDQASPKLALKDDAAWLSQAIKRTNFGLWRWDLVSDQAFWNDNLFRMFGLPVGEPVTDPELFYTLVHPDDREHCRLALQRSLQTGAEYRAQFRVVREGGSVVWIESIAQVICDENGKPIAMEGGATEITDRVQTERELADTHASYQKAVTSSGMVVYQYDFAGDNYSTANLAQLEEMFGKPYLGSHSRFYESLEVLDYQLLGELAGLDVVSGIKKFHSGEATTWRSEFSFRKADGQVRWIYDNAYLIRDAEGKPTATFGILQDITELRLLSASVEQIVEETGDSSSEYLHQLALALGRTLGARYVKVAVMHHQEPVTLESVALVIDGKIQPNIIAPIVGIPCEKFLTENVSIFDETIRSRYPQFEPLEQLDIQSGFGIALKSRAGQTIGAMLLLLDRPLDDSLDALRVLRLFGTYASSELERRQKEEELSELNQSLEALVEERTIDLKRANGELESFAYSVSHDLRQPLRAIDGFARILDMDYGDLLDAEAKGHIETIRTATRRMSNLIDDLLRLSRLISHDIRVRKIDIGKIAKESFEALNPDGEARPHTFIIEDGLHAVGDESLMRAVMDNLIQNAWKFTARTAHVEMKVGRRDGAFYVEDNGVGFDMRYVNKLFEPFQRLHVREDFEGTGVGLATVRRIVERHKGRVWAESELDIGTTIYFTLPEK